MRELGPADFIATTFPQPLDRDEIQLWFFPHWPDPTRQLAESARLRRLLAAHLRRPLREVRIDRGAYGKPRVRDGRLSFNLSHSGQAVLLSLSRRGALGVDLEMRSRRRPVLELARRWFDPREARALARLPARQRQTGFLRLWNCKEAVLKAHGRGIGHGLQRISIRLGAGGMPAGFYADSARPGPHPWQVLILRPDTHHYGALAWRGSARLVRAFVVQSR